MSAAFQGSAPVNWRAVVALGLLAGYMVLANHGIYCQYFTPPDAHHNGSPSTSPDHTVQCVLANHGSAALPSVDSQVAPSPSLPSLLRLSSSSMGVTTLVPPTPARAPPIT